MTNKVVLNRAAAIKLFFMAIDHDDPYWTDLVEDHLVFDEKDNVIDWPNQWVVGRAMGFTNEEMETATGAEKGRLEKLGL